MIHPWILRYVALLAAAVLVATAGCARRVEDFQPAGAPARKALEAALTAWQNGQPYGRVGDGRPVIEPVDSRWKGGQKLGGFEILKEESGQGPSVFEVRLSLTKPAAKQTVRYVVVGKDPLWVYREEDFKGTTGM